ncbi:regulator of Vps4 activity in the MVB pathway-domain-containing protein [Coprinopsis sp. MPI-PUGE-AT-0042]|nr:regulator of Vps4 activity in the MVB pathway-domain-containing protein [Coprinopsis sp. MPI-PUGE-AT-0042]
MSLWNSAKAKVQLRLSVQRLRTLQQKKEAQAKASRRDIATLLERGKLETARVKVEAIINEDIYVELLELLELYCELLIARFGILDQNTRVPDPGISEGVCAVIHAAPRTELKELHILRDLLMHKYGREFSTAVMENKDQCVSDRVVKKLIIATPASELVDAYLAEIARAYGVPWRVPGQDSDDTEGGTKVQDEPSEEKKLDASGKDAAATASPSNSPPSPAVVEDPFEALSKRFDALKKR